MNIGVRIKRNVEGFVWLDLFFNGELVSGPCGIIIREAEIRAFIMAIGGRRVDLTAIREFITDTLFERLEKLGCRYI